MLTKVISDHNIELAEHRACVALLLSDDYDDTELAELQQASFLELALE